MNFDLYRWLTNYTLIRPLTTFKFAMSGTIVAGNADSSTALRFGRNDKLLGMRRAW